jgi:hypothetical protein
MEAAKGFIENIQWENIVLVFTKVDLEGGREEF